MLFFGHYEHTIDAKKRLAIPSEIRNRWSQETDGEAWFAVPWREGLIRLYTERAFHERAFTRSTTLTPGDSRAELEATLFGLSARLPMDSAGRIRFPEDMLEILKIPSEVVLVGAGDRLELRNRAEWRSSKLDRLKQLPDLLKRIEEEEHGR